MKNHETEKQQKLDSIEVRLARHEKVSRIILLVVVILAGLVLALLLNHLHDHATQLTK